MKKCTLVLAAALLCLSAAAHELNNPVGADGRYIVKYDCAKGAFAASNDIEADETFTFAVDVTSKGNVNGETNRIKQINGNIFGMTVNYAQIFSNDSVLKVDVLAKDSILYIYGQIFGFEFTAEEAGAGWWMWNDQPIEPTQAPGADCLFAFLPYTGTKSSEEFYGDDFDEPMFGFGEKGYAAPCVLSTAIDAIEQTTSKAGKFVRDGQLYIRHNGLIYNALGTVVEDAK